ncbi:MAG: UDP-N-acetylmuramoyl-tripeptide--D-alanyl-D-alanine ligase, partial [Clostridia bacterium]
MENLTVEDIVRESNGKLILGDKKFICRKFSKDTRIIEEGDIYIAIKGEKFDGNKFWREALKKGAAGVIIEKNNCTDDDKRKFENKIIIEVEDTLEALYCIAKYKRSLYNIPVIAITGSVGKTSTKDIVANVVNKKYTTLKTLGNNNNNIGLPFTILKMQNEEAMVLEMGMNHFGEISLLTSIAKPTICVITNIGTSHIGNLGSRENILKAKLEILEGCENPVVIINNDNDLLHNWYEENKDKLNIKTYGIKEKSDLNAKNIKLESSNSKFDLKLNEKEETINVPVGGEHFILNSLCAAMVGKVLKIDNQKIKEGIESFELTKKRMDITELENGVKVINDA